MGDNELGHLIRFVQGLQDAHISYSLDSVRSWGTLANSAMYATLSSCLANRGWMPRASCTT